MLTGGDIVVQLSKADWKALLVHEIAWHDVYDAAKLCEVPGGAP